MKNILVTGGAGYIGSHMTRMLLEKGYAPVVFDNLSTGHREFLPKGARFIEGDLKSQKAINDVFAKYPIDAVMHFAASIVVSESIVDPFKYYANNFYGSLNLLTAMLNSRVKLFIFSSTAAVYGQTNEALVTEATSPNPLNPYARSKYMVEQVLQDISLAHDFRYVTLRYFNVAGSHPSADIGILVEKPTHLIPSIMAVLSGRKRFIEVFGDDYDTPDGTCIRDYIYVMDLCLAHLLALEYLKNEMPSDVFNLGSGRGFSVKEVINAAEKVVGQKINTKIARRRPGDITKIVADFTKAHKILGWKPQGTLEQIIRTSWAFENLRQGLRKNIGEPPVVLNRKGAY